MTTLFSAPDAEILDTKIEDVEYGVVNEQYPASYWLIAFSKDVQQGEVVPLHRLERDLLLWRDTTGRLRCQDHVCKRGLGRMGGSWTREGGRVVCPEHRERFTACKPYRVVERYDGIYVWNGPSEPDHEIPDIGGSEGIDEDDVHYLTWRCLLPFPGKAFSENLPDAAHFAFLHHTGEWAEASYTQEASHRFFCRAGIQGKRKKLTLSPHELVKLWREDRLGDIVEFSGDLDATIYGGGFNVFKMAAAPDAPAKQGIAGRVRHLVESTPVINCLTPVTADSHLLMVIMPMPDLRTPLFGGLPNAILDAAAIARNWAVVKADIAVLTHRDESPSPRYNQMDRALVAYRRFWDRRLMDRSLGAGDNKHSNGRRAGVAWQEDLGAGAGGSQ